MIDNDVLLFSATNEETPYEQLLHYWTFLSDMESICFARERLVSTKEACWCSIITYIVYIKIPL